VSDTLDTLAEHLADVSPQWREVVTAAPTGSSLEFADALGAERALGVEAIREGWLLHRRASRIAADASPDLALLVGDWCYAAGLCTITEHGSLDDVAALAALVADSSMRAGESLDAIDARWAETTEAMARG